MKEYEVTGPVAFQGNEPGSKFKEKLSPATEKRAIARGAITVVKQSQSKEKPAESDAPGDASGGLFGKNKTKEGE